MSQTDHLIDLLKMLVPTIVVLVAVLFIIKQFFNEEKERRIQSLRMSALDKMLPIRLNAYERLVVFVERMNPSSLLLRNYEPGISAAQLQAKALEEIRAEFEHNLSQQLYVSYETWEVIKKIKNESSALINEQMAHLPTGSSGSALSQKIFEKLSHHDPNPYDFALSILKDEVRPMF